MQLSLQREGLSKRIERLLFQINHKIKNFLINKNIMTKYDIYRQGNMI